jgi:hypothetical protein
MKLVFILIIAFGIIIYSIIRAFSAIVGAGGNLPKIISEVQKMNGKTEQNANQIEDYNDMINKPASQTYRTIAGILFSVLLFYPFVIFGEKPAIEMETKWRLLIFVLLIIAEVVLFQIIRRKDHDYQQNILNTHNDDNKTPRA